MRIFKTLGKVSPHLKQSFEKSDWTLGNIVFWGIANQQNQLLLVRLLASTNQTGYPANVSDTDVGPTGRAYMPAHLKEDPKELGIQLFLHDHMGYYALGEGEAK